MSEVILCLGFDGVIHSYNSGWKGARCIPDPPVPVALEFLVSAIHSFQVNIFSSRSHYFWGRRAMKQWLRHSLLKISGIDSKDKWRIPNWKVDEIPYWWFRFISNTASAKSWPNKVEFAIRCLLKEIKWPVRKPLAHVTIDDRALCFTGVFPDFERIIMFKPWNKVTDTKLLDSSLN